MSEIDISEFLLKEGFEYATFIDFDKSKEAHRWCREKLGYNLEWIAVINKFYFKSKDDIIEFKLVWK